MKPQPNGQALAVALFLPSLAGGGAERVFVDLANEFAARGMRVDLVLATAEGPYLDDVSSSVRVVDLHAPRTLRALPALVRYLRGHRPVAMLSALDHANVVAALACRLANVPTQCVISMRSVPSQVYRRSDSLRSRILLRLMKLTYGLADAIIANSHAVAHDVSRMLGIPAAGIRVINNPVNLARLEKESRVPLTHEWLADGAPPIVLGVGSLGPLKDFETLIRAFAMVRQSRACRLVILGEGPDRKKLESVARVTGVWNHILLPGFVGNPFPWMRRASVFVSSSVTEGFPNVIVQALALGLPVVSTNCVGGSAELLEDGRWGKLVPVGEPEAMAAAIAACLEHGHEGDPRRRAADFSHERIVNRFLEVLLPWEKPA